MTVEYELIFLPAAGYRNGSSLNNAGSNGNYWSRSLNESNSNNAYNLNFNSSNFNRNNNNRYYGQSVRPVVSALAFHQIDKVCILPFSPFVRCPFCANSIHALHSY